ncbi:MAG: hypothetical protein HDT25_05460 [Ruminococcus sp.]|nr:hypothetical protein [Ruminococcus sp.]
MSNEDIAKMKALDEAAEKAGGFVSVNEKNVDYDYRKIIAYCKKKGIEPIDLTIRELNTFILQ